LAETIIITIDNDGATEIQVDGHKGPGCKDLTKALEDALGSVSGDRLTNEFHERQEVRRVRQ